MTSGVGRRGVLQGGGAGLAIPSDFAKMPVAMPPGEIELTRTPSSPSYIAAQRVMWITAAFAMA
jgi:hypothetical protein